MVLNHPTGSFADLCVNKIYYQASAVGTCLLLGAKRSYLEEDDLAHCVTIKSAVSVWRGAKILGGWACGRTRALFLLI